MTMLCLSAQLFIGPSPWRRVYAPARSMGVVGGLFSSMVEEHVRLYVFPFPIEALGRLKLRVKLN